MKREIKFRAWDKETKTMYFPNQYGTTINTVNGKEIKTPKQNKFLEDLQRFFGLIILSKDIELMQFTGLKDKNGKEIYEGDILKSISEFNGYTGMDSDIYGGQIYQVEYEGKGFVLSPDPITNHLVKWGNCEVIGNRFENPELLKEVTE